MKSETINEVLDKLIGKIEPVGETNIDSERFENLKTVIGVVDDLLIRIEEVAQYKNYQEHSIKRSAEFAEKWLKSTKDELWCKY